MKRSIESRHRENKIIDDKRPKRHHTAYNHPLNVKPLANVLLTQSSDFMTRIDGLGLLSQLPDQLILFIVKYLPVSNLFSSCQISKAFLIFCSTDSLWEGHCFQKFQKTAPRLHCWKSTYRGQQTPIRYPKLPQLYSDVLYYDWFYATVDMREWVGEDNIERKDSLSFDQFLKEYNQQSKPVIFTDITKNWPCYSTWAPENLTEKGLRVLSGVTNQFKPFTKFQFYYTSMYHLAPPFQYHLFKDSTGKPSQTLPDQFTVPDYFTEDLFSVLPDRPPYRWLLLGGARSGSCFHQDPNFTAAWNASLYGRKKFVLFPGDIVPPGIEQIGEDDFEPPNTVIQWFVEHYSSLKKGTFLEAVVHPGEMIFVPSGWWHTVLNLDETIAVTQNFVDRVNLSNVCSYLKAMKPCLYKDFMQNLKTKKPEMIQYISEGRSEWDDMIDGDESNGAFFL